MITDAGLEAVAHALGEADPLQVLYVALGTDGTAPAAADTDLGAEVFRKQITQVSYPATGQVTLICYVAPGEANFAIAEVGWFADASSTSGSGILIARELYSRNKTALESLQLQLTIDVDRT